jgi:hypothetical protein
LAAEAGLTKHVQIGLKIRENGKKKKKKKKGLTAYAEKNRFV